MSASPQPPVPASCGGATTERRFSRSQLRSPTVDRGLLQIPPLSRLKRIVEGNAVAFERFHCTGEWLEDLRPCAEERQTVRTEVWLSARRWTQQLLAAASPAPRIKSITSLLSERFAAPNSTSARWVVTGHQPALIHPGVWIKNLAVAALSRRLESGVGLNLIVDNDIAPSPSLLIPAGTPEVPHWESLAYDTTLGAAPWEETRVTDRELFGSFGIRVEQALSSWGIVPLAVEFWPRVLQAERVLGNPGWAFAAARAVTEWSWGSGNLELPLSELCQLPGFHRFVVRLLNQLPRFHSVYNQALANYRQTYRIRSRTHPVPDLRADHDWLEAPFWIWLAGDRQRRRLMVRKVDDQLELSDGHDFFETLPTASSGLSAAVDVLGGLAQRGIRLRTRALTTTLFSRLYLADLFVHGIGGAKYDEMTDQIIRDLCQMQPPQFATLSATVRLPLPSFPMNARVIRQCIQELRSAEQHPAGYLDHPSDNPTHALVSEMNLLIAEQQAFRLGEAEGTSQAGSGPRRFRRFQQIRQQLRAATEQTRRQLTQQLAEAERQLAANRILCSREYAFCLFPPELLRSFFKDACSAID